MAVKTPASSNRQVREANARAILLHLWAVEALTGSDLMGSTGLTRATVHDVCQELQALGWIEELDNQRVHGDYVKGRPARRYALSARAGVVVGVDSGEHRVIATVADLRGGVISQRVQTFSIVRRPTTDLARRLRTVEGVILEALEAAGVPTRAVLAVAVGVPAPVVADGRTVIRTEPFWNRMNPDIGAHLAQAQGWRVLVDNDANLAALAEGWRGQGRGQRHFVTLLAGERLGAGVIEDGHLFRGGRGAGGEMVWLDLVEGVGSAAGIAALSRRWALEALGSAHPETSPILGGLALEDITPEQVFAAARQGDPLASSVIRRLGDRFTRVSAVIGKVFDTDVIILAGAVASACDPILDIIREDLPRTVGPPVPRVVSSLLGEAVVSIGAVRRALDHVQEYALEIALPDLVRNETKAAVPAGSIPVHEVSTAVPPGGAVLGDVGSSPR